MKRPGWALAAALALAAGACSGTRDPPPRRAVSASVPASASSIAAAPTDLALLVLRGDSAYSRAEFDSAGVFFEFALTQARALHDSVTQARILTSLGLVAWRRGDLGKARRLGEQALGLKLLLRLQADLFRSYNALGLLASDDGRLADATVLYQKAAELARAYADTASLAKTVNNLAMVYHAQGRFAEARAGYVEARSEGRKVGEAKTEGRALNNLASLDIQMGDPGSAIPRLTEALVLLRSVGDRAGEQNALGQLGTAYDALGEPGLAFAALDSALAASRKQGLRQEEASNLELIAGLHRQAGDLQRALALYEQGNRLNGEIGLTAEQGTNLRNSAEIQAALGRPDLARNNAHEALRLHQKAGDPLAQLRDHLMLADLAASAAEPTAVVQGHLREAEDLSQALDARIARVEVALARAAIADRQGNARSVLGTLDKAQRDLTRGGFGGEWQAALFRARAYARLSRLDSAAAAGREAVAAVERVRGGFGSSFLRAAFAVDKAAVYADQVDVLLRLGRTGEAFEVADAARSHALLEHLVSATGAAASRGTVRSLAEGEAILRRIAAFALRLDSLEATPPPQRDAEVAAQIRGLSDDLAEARGAYEALLVEVGERDATGTALLGGRRARIDEVQAALGKDEALLEYLVTPERVIVFAVTRDEVRSTVTDIALDDLARRVRLARDLAGEPGGPDDGENEVLTALHEVLVAPAERAGLLAGVRRVILVPHSVLAYLPFAALRREGTGRYMMENYSLVYLPAAAALVARTGQVGDETRLPGAAVFAPFTRTLPGTAREARSVRRALPGATAREGSRATELRLREALAAGGMVHVASHGVMNPRNPMFSRIELALGGGGSDDDGRLEVHELLGLRISAPLVFLSGCETGVGAAWSTQFARGEDYATLAQAFLYAGARSVAATLWQIGDNGAALFAERFYARLTEMSPADALAAAQREMARDPRYSRPYYWAGYQVFGQGNPGPDPHRSGDVSVQRK